MLVTIAFILVILWILFVVGFHLATWLVHLLLIAAVIVIAIRLIRRDQKDKTPRS